MDHAVTILTRDGLPDADGNSGPSLTFLSPYISTQGRRFVLTHLKGIALTEYGPGGLPGPEQSPADLALSVDGALALLELSPDDRAAVALYADAVRRYHGPHLRVVIAPDTGF